MRSRSSTDTLIVVDIQRVYREVFPLVYASVLVTSRDATGDSRSTRAIASVSDVEAELHHVTVGHHVVLALDAHPAGGLGRGHRLGRHQIGVRDHFGLDEAPLEVGVDHPGGLWRGRALLDGPGPGFLGTCGQVRLQPEGVKTGAR